MTDQAPGPSEGVGWDSIRATLMERFWRGVFVLALVALPFSVLRAYYLGWQPVNFLHWGMAGLVVVLNLMPYRLSPGAKAALAIGLIWLVGLTALVTFGLLSYGINALLLSCLMTSMLYSMRTALLLAAAVTAVVAVTGIGFSTGYLDFPIDANQYVRSPLVWAGAVLVPILFALLIIVAISVFQESIRALLDEVRRQRDVIAHQAIHDPLTGLPSMRLASDRLEVSIHRARRSESMVAVMFIDLDGFKLVNDQSGHEAGDHVLATVGSRLREVIRSIDTAARIGGDEFMVILSDIPDRGIAGEVAETLLAAIAQPIPYKAQLLTVSASIGISLFPDHGNDFGTLKRTADEAMYGVKGAGKNGYAFFAAEADTAAPGRPAALLHAVGRADR